MIYLRTSIGIEIRREDLLITCLQSNFASGVFTHFKRIPDYRSREKAEVRREIELFFKSRRLKRDDIVLGIPRQDVVVRHLEFPSEVADNLRQVVLYQVQSYEPTEEEKFYFDYAPLRSTPGAKKLSVLLVMIKKSLLDDYLSALRDLGIKPASVTIGSVALTNLFLRSGKETAGKTYILAHLTGKGIEIMALRDGALVYSKEGPGPVGSAWHEFLLREVESATGKVRLGPEGSIEKIILAGEQAEEVQREVREFLPDCELIGASVRFEMPLENRSRLQEAAASLGMAFTGLVRRPPLKLNLLPMNQRVQQTRWAYVPTIILGLVILGLLCGLGFHQVIQQRILLRKLDAEILGLRDRVSRVQAIQAESKAVEKQLRYIEGILRERDMNLEVLQELTKTLPPDTFLNVYMNQKGSIQISGLSMSAPDLIPKLEQSPLLQNVVQRGTVFKDAQSGKDRFSFDAKLERQP